MEIQYIGARIYYDLLTGEEVLKLVEKIGFASKTDVEQDIAKFIELSGRVRESFDYIDLEYGQYAQDFAECNGYRVNIETKELEFSYPDPNAPEIEQPYQAPLSEMVSQLQQENTLLKAQAQANADVLEFHEDLITELAIMVMP